ncbi:hypothetical protein [Caulobacter sp. NIBR2454]|uniref:hypothetical protein n=1 Tax=Caulobacter sp. NIBR2454 TaxID=3015996 RepID=UPI0022B6AF79|nr:hypothetical protein [Caulobacter sp. NIBR2454]
MATYEELEEAFTAINRKAPSGAHALILQELAVRSQNGVITDEAAHAYAADQAVGTTSVAALTYQFFTGEVPNTDGFDYLVNSTKNANDLNDPSYQTFNTENRYINFAVNLGVAGEGRADFLRDFGSLTFGEAVAVAYNRIIGTSQAAEAGVDVNAAIANIAGRKAYFDAIARAGAPAADTDLAAKAAMAGYIMAEAVKAKVGVYAQGLAGLYDDLGEDGLIHGSFDLNDYVVAKSPPGNQVALQVGESYGVGAVGEADAFSNNADTAFGLMGPANVGDEIVIETGNGRDFFGKQGFLTSITGLAGASITIDLGGGDDFLDAVFTEAGDITLDGGVGRDVLDLKLSSDLEDTEVTGFEQVNLSSDNGLGWTVDFSNFEGVDRVVIAGNAADSFTVENLTADIEVLVSGGGGAILGFDDVDEMEVIMEGDLGTVTVEGVEDVLTISTGGAATWNGLKTSASELVVVTRRSLDLGVVEAGGDDRKINLAGATKDVALLYVTDEGAAHTVLLGSGDDVLDLTVRSQEAVTVTLGDGDDTVNLAGVGNAAAFTSAGALKAVTRLTDFGEDDTLVLGEGASTGLYAALAANAFTGVEETDEAYFEIVGNAVAVAGAWSYTAFDAADGSGVIIYSTGGDEQAFDDDFYIKLVGVSMDDLDIDDNVITHG